MCADPPKGDRDVQIGARVDGASARNFLTFSSFGRVRSRVWPVGGVPAGPNFPCGSGPNR
jgi:hypothetical protein